MVGRVCGGGRSGLIGANTVLLDGFWNLLRGMLLGADGMAQFAE